MDEIKNESNDLNNPNDKFFKGTTSMVIVAKPLLQETLPEEVLDTLDLDTLEIDPNSYITGVLKERFSDIVWSCRMKNSQHRKKISFLFEHKSYKPKHPHFQLLDYIRGAWEMQVNAGKRPEQMVPIVFYHGIDKWVYEPFESYFEEVDGVYLKYFPSFEYILVNMADYTDEKIKTLPSVFLQKMFSAFKHYRDTVYLKEHFFELVFEGYPNRKNEQRIWFTQAIGVYLAAISGLTRKEIVKKIETSNNNLKSEAMSTFEEFVQEFVQEGIEKGIEIEAQKHERELKLKIYNAWKQGYELELLANVFSLPLKQVKEIITEIKAEMENNAQ